MSELVQGPVQKWELSENNMATIDRLLASESELDKVYGEAYRLGFFVKEFGGVDEDHGIAAVGELDNMTILEFRTGKDVDISELTLGDCMLLGAFPGGDGTTRTERVRNGIKGALEWRNKERDPETLDLFGSFTESGFKVDAYMPANAQQSTVWTVKIYKEGEEEPFRTETIPMFHEPIFGVDVDDKAILERRVDEIMRELTV